MIYKTIIELDHWFIKGKSMPIIVNKEQKVEEICEKAYKEFSSQRDNFITTSRQRNHWSLK